MFDERGVARLASRYFEVLLGSRFPGRVHLAGGAFKSLIHGRRPRDLDLWAYGKSTREHLVTRLVERGATLEADNQPYQRVFQLDGVTTEVAYTCGYGTVAERVSSFDIGLSAVGCTWDDGQLTPYVHPMARRCVERKAVLLLREEDAEYLLPNWKYALATLERMRRYADELGYRLPESEVEAVWRVFERQDVEMKRGMLERYRKVAWVTPEIEKEALCRIRQSSLVSTPT